MAELLVVGNPRRRRRKRGHRKGRMPAGLRRYWAAKRRGHKSVRRHRRRRSAVARVHRRRRRSSGGRRSAVGYTIGTRRIRRRKLNPHRRRYRLRHRRNPSFSVRGITGQVMPTIKAGGVGALGALGLDVAWGLVNNQLPTFAAYLTNPYVGYAAKAVMAVGVGALGGKVLRGKGTAMAVGAMTVVTHDFLKSLLQGMAPTMFGPGGSLPLGAYLSGSAPLVGTAAFPTAYLPFGAYLSGATGQTDGSGTYTDDAMGFDPWNSQMGA